MGYWLLGLLSGGFPLELEDFCVLFEQLDLLLALLEFGFEHFELGRGFIVEFQVDVFGLEVHAHACAHPSRDTVGWWAFEVNSKLFGVFGLLDIGAVHLQHKTLDFLLIILDEGIELFPQMPVVIVRVYGQFIDLKHILSLLVQWRRHLFSYGIQSPIKLNLHLAQVMPKLFYLQCLLVVDLQHILLDGLDLLLELKELEVWGGGVALWWAVFTVGIVQLL